MEGTAPQLLSRLADGQAVPAATTFWYMSDLPTGTVTFLFTDIEGSTRLWEQHPEAMREALARHDEIVRVHVEDAGGHIIKSTGDGVLAVFPRADHALLAAVTAQIAFQGEEFAGVGQLKVRMALHTGEASERNGDYFGPPLNRVARLLALSHGGQVLASAATREVVSDLLPAEASLLDLGEHRLRDLGRPERVFQIAHPRLRREFPPLASLDAHLNNLPSLLGSFVGRQGHVSRVMGLLEQFRLVTLTGVGGTGKTRLSLEVAAGLVDRFADGVWLVELAPLGDSGLVGPTVAATVGVEAQPDRAVLDTLQERLADREMLLVLDNCEHVIEAVAETAGALLRSCERLRVLATSREALGLPGERAELVQPLPYPQELPDTPQRLLDYEAVRLFTERAQSVVVGFEVDADTMGPVATICSDLEGIPLALELAAARTRVLTVDQIAARVGEQLGVLSGYSAVDERHRAMRTALDWSYELLEVRERELFCRLSVFRGGATVEAVQSVCGEPSEEAVLDLLDGLVAKSMLTADPTPSGMRYRLLEPLRQYAEEKLEDEGATAETVERHWLWFDQFGRTAEPKVRGRDQLEWLDRVEAEHDNLRVALDRAFEASHVETCVSITGSLCWFWFLHSHIQDWERWLPRLIEAGKGSEPRIYIRLLLAAAQYSWELGRLDRGRLLLGQVLKLAEQVESGTLLGWGNAYLGLIEFLDERPEKAQRYLKEAGGHFVSSGVEAGLGFVGWLLASISLARIEQGTAKPRDDPDALVEGLERIVGGARHLGDRNFLAHGLASLSYAHLLRGDWKRAQKTLSEGTLALHELGNKYCLAHHLEFSAKGALARGEPARATRLLAASDALRERLGTPGTPSDQHRRDSLRARLATELDAESLQEAFADGTQLSIDDAVALAARPPD